ncbi:hypothetical protein CARUB_v10022731mg [Capsella rubella]|uniref:DUF629 domain-containing protein n=1 Tax=Capsella rubella TaxID=81985 RepID=R0HAB8_9BRAS|nr:uncharacterized protein LOC17888195 [Capsella rubella]EOA26349.1 hypothetical protein CARUB_v10022731mg [Capsella rubella]
METRSEKSDDGKTRKKLDDAAKLARDSWNSGNRIKALEITEKTISEHGNHEKCFGLHELQGDIFYSQALKTDNTDVKCVYLFASVDAYSMATLLSPNSLRSFRGYARSLIQLGDQLGVNKFYENVSKAKPGLSITQPQGHSTEVGYFDKMMTELQKLIHVAATQKMHQTVTAPVPATRTMANQKELGKEDPSFNRLKNIWVKLDDKTKREFLVVGFEKLIDYIQDKHGTKVKEHFQKCVPIANNLRWRFWKCHICSQVNYCFTDCKMHILDSHVHKFEPAFSARPKYVDGVLADMISSGDWKPVDTAKAANLIKDRTKSREEIVYVNGWCSDWPLAEDEERENILKQFAELLKSSCPKENRTLSCTLWEWLIDYTEEHLDLPGVRRCYLDQCSFFKNPQCICFLDLKHLEYILKYFRQLTTDVRTSLVSKVVNQYWENSQVKERIDLEGVTTYNLLLDKRLLYEEKLEFDNIGTVEHCKSTGIYKDVIPKGDKMVSWVLDCPEIDQELVSQIAKGIHNREIWLAALRIVRRMVRKRESYYGKRHKMLTYEKMLGEAEAICDREDTRKNVNQRIKYAFALQMKCEGLIVKHDDDTKCFLSVVRDVFEKQKSPRFEVSEDMECISRLSTTFENDDVKESLLRLRKSLKEKFVLIDSKILLNESNYEKLIDVFPKLSGVEYRLVVLPFVKKFLQDKLVKVMKRNSSSVAAGDSAEREGKKSRL